MIAYRYDDKFMYVGVQMCQRDPIASAKAGKEIYLLPAQCTHAVPPEPKEGFNIVWTGEAWEYQEIPAEPEPETPEPHVPTLQEKIEQLNADYESARFELGKYYMEAFLDGDVDSQKELKTELDNVKAQYNADLNDLMNE